MLGSFIIAWSMYSRVPCLRFSGQRTDAVYHVLFSPDRRSDRRLNRGVFLSVRGAGSGNLVDSPDRYGAAAFYDRGNPYGWISGYDGCQKILSAEGKKLEILKDPRAGAFAVIGCGTYLLFYAALFSELDQRSVLLFSGAFLTERALSGMSVVSFPMAKKDGLAASFSQAALKRTVRLVMALYLMAGAAYFLAMGKVLFGSILPGWLCILAAGAVFAWYYRMACREFGGITGDLAGYFLQVCELLLLAVCVLCGWLYPA